MKRLFLLLMLTATGFAADVPCNTGRQQKTSAALIQLEMGWVAAINSKDSDALRCILEPGFADSGVNGQVRDRQTVLAQLPKHPNVEQHLRDLRAVIEGDTGVVRGVNHVIVPGKGAADVRFTDTFVYRDHLWRALSAQETLVRPTKTAGKE